MPHRSLTRRAAELVVVAPSEPVRDPGRPPALAEVPYLPASVLIRFDSATLDDTCCPPTGATIDTLDAHQHCVTRLHGIEVPVAANFSGRYALWLARSDFGRQALHKLLGLRDALQHPRVYPMQPYDPSRLTVVAVHGLASSPEAWINWTAPLELDTVGSSIDSYARQRKPPYSPARSAPPMNLR